MDEVDLLVVGDVNPDVIVAGADLVPTFGQAEQVVDRADLVVGGSATITAMGAARLGLAVDVCGVLGADPLGEFMTTQVSARGVDMSRVRRDPSRPTGLSVILDRGHDRAILTAPGTIGALTPDDLVSLPDRPARHVHVASYFLMSAELRAALPAQLARWRAAGATTSVDPNWDPAGEWAVADLLAHTDVFLPNAAELRAVSGCADLADGLADLAAQGCDVVVKVGGQGAAAHAFDGTTCVVAALPAPTFCDPIGAGDSFDAGYLTGWLAGADLADSLRLAVAAGTLSTRAVGGTAAQPDRTEAQEWASRLVAGQGRGDLR